MRTVFQTARFAKDVKVVRKRGKDLAKLDAIVWKLVRGEALDPRCRDHPLRGRWANCRDCHIEPDWVLIYRLVAVSLRLERTGTHADLFE